MSNSPFITQAESLQNIQESYQLLNAKLDKKENIANKVQVINKESTEVEYPSAKSVYDFVNEYVKTENILPTSEIMTLVANNGLIPGNYYLINDFQTIYTIKGSNSAPKLTKREIKSVASPWGMLGVYDKNLVSGKEVTVTKLPDGYVGPITIGSKTNVYENYANYYFDFKNNMHLEAGFEFTYEMPRYSNGLADNLVVNDINGRPVIRPGGVLNTEVHDGTPYMLMSAEENINVPVEEIILIAKSTNEFELIGKSITYVDDIIEYKLPVEGEFSIKGTILRRSNRALEIDIPVDWRVIKYRRWRLDSDSILKLLNQNITTEESLTRVGTAFQFTAIFNTTATPDRFFVAKDLDDTSLTLDKYTKIVKFPMIVSSQSDAKDYTIFPLDENRNPLVPTIFQVGDKFSNVVFQLNSSDHNYDVLIKVQNIYNTTFVCGCEVVIKEIDNTIFLDSTYIAGSTNNSIISNSVFLITTLINAISESKIFEVLVGTSTNDYPQYLDGTAPSRWVYFANVNNSFIKNSAIGGVISFFKFIGTELSDCTLFSFTTINNPDNINYQTAIPVSFLNSIMLSMSILNRAETGNLIFESIYCDPLEIPAGPSFRDLYINNALIKNITITRNKFNKKLYYKELDINDVETIKTYATLVVPPVVTP